MKTPEEIIDEELGRHDVFSVQSNVVKGLMQSFDAAGYVIVRKEPTDEQCARPWSGLLKTPVHAHDKFRAVYKLMTGPIPEDVLFAMGQTQETRQSED